MGVLTRILRCVAGLACISAPLAACSQGYPAKPIRIVVPFPPGPAADMVARLVGGR